MARDDFLQKTKDTLAKQVAFRCSNPGCRKVTIGPSGSGEINNIGVAAHITAASEGGPRFDSEVTHEERKSSSNGLWLCQNCAADIDRDELRYKKELLFQWKESAIQTARDEHGKKLPTEPEIIDSLVTALGGEATSLPKNIISNSHSAVEKSLEKIDPRFKITTSRIDGQNIIGISPKERVSLTFQIGGTTKDEFMNQYQSLTEHGGEFNLESQDISVMGSPLFEKNSQDAVGKMAISGHKKAAKQKLWLVSEDGLSRFHFDDIDGYLSAGTKSFSFSGSNCGGLFEIAIKADAKSDSNATFHMDLILKKWDGVNLLELPYFEKLYSFIKKLNCGWLLYSSIEIDGQILTESEGDLFKESQQIAYLASYLRYTHRARVVSKGIDKDILFRSDTLFTTEEHIALADAADLFEETLEILDKNGGFSCTIYANEGCENIRELVNSDPQKNSLILPENTALKIFQQTVDLPTKIYEIEKVKAVVRGDIESLKEGELVTVDWVPVEGFRMNISYKSDSSLD